MAVDEEMVDTTADEEITVTLTWHAPLRVMQLRFPQDDPPEPRYWECGAAIPGHVRGIRPANIDDALARLDAKLRLRREWYRRGMWKQESHR